MKIPLVQFRSMKTITPSMAIREIAHLIAWISLVCCAWMTHAESARAAEPIKIGAVLSFSGGVELYGR